MAGYRDGVKMGDTISFTWSIEDVKSIDSSLTDDEAREILANFESHHEGSMDAMWQDLDLHVGMFNREKEEENG